MNNFRLTSKATFFTALLFCWVLVGHANAAAKISDIKVRMFLQHSGEFSPALKGNEALWNTVIGEGDIAEPSNAALVDVVIVENIPSNKQQFVKLIVKSKRNGKILVIRQERVGLFNSSGETHIGFWLSAIGCEEIDISASINEQVKKISIPFRCGE